MRRTGTKYLLPNSRSSTRSCSAPRFFALRCEKMPTLFEVGLREDVRFMSTTAGRARRHLLHAPRRRFKRQRHARRIRRRHGLRIDLVVIHATAPTSDNRTLSAAERLARTRLRFFTLLPRARTCVVPACAHLRPRANRADSSTFARHGRPKRRAASSNPLSGLRVLVADDGTERMCRRARLSAAALRNSSPPSRCSSSI